MVYRKKRDTEMIGRGNFEGYEWGIVSYGTHPCAYILIEPGHELYKADYSRNYDLYSGLDVHGGITYTEAGLHDFVDSDYWVIGWDYNHLGDYNAMTPNAADHKYTTDEIFGDIVDCIGRLKFLYD